MDNKIKEILSFKEDTDYKRLSIEDILLLKDYITNSEKKVNNLTNSLNKKVEEGINLQNKIDKAIEQCKQDAEDIWEWEGSYAYMGMFEEIINILKGSDSK